MECTESNTEQYLHVLQWMVTLYPEAPHTYEHQGTRQKKWRNSLEKGIVDDTMS